MHAHFTPTSGSWLNLVEVWFSIIGRQAVRRGTFRSVRDLNIKIGAFTTGWNQRQHPFIWTKTADEVLTRINREKTSTAATSVGSVPAEDSAPVALIDLDDPVLEDLVRVATSDASGQRSDSAPDWW